MLLVKTREKPTAPSALRDTSSQHFSGLEIGRKWKAILIDLSELWSGMAVHFINLHQRLITGQLSDVGDVGGRWEEIGVEIVSEIGVEIGSEIGVEIVSEMGNISKEWVEIGLE